MTNQATPPKPLPIPQPEWDFYWEKAKQHELWLMRCKDCSKSYFYPRPICPHCFSRNTEWFQSSGKGTLYAFAIVHRAPMPSFRDDAPYVVAYIELEGGARMPTNLVGIADPDSDKVKIGMAVQVDFEDRTAEISLPVFRPA
jgi:uncharacterized OB-fold protein